MLQNPTGAHLVSLWTRSSWLLCHRNEEWDYFPVFSVHFSSSLKQYTRQQNYSFREYKGRNWQKEREFEWITGRWSDVIVKGCERGLTEVSEVRVLARTIMCETMSWQSDLTLFILYHSNRRTLKRWKWKNGEVTKVFYKYLCGWRSHLFSD